MRKKPEFRRGKRLGPLEGAQRESIGLILRFSLVSFPFRVFLANLPKNKVLQNILSANLPPLTGQIRGLISICTSVFNNLCVNSDNGGAALCQRAEPKSLAKALLLSRATGAG